jgi:hypothetical protein
MPRFNPDRCPQCGQPARTVIMMLRVRVGLKRQGNITQAERDAPLKLVWSDIKRAGGTHLPPGTFAEPVLSCGGLHEWDAEVVD